MTDDGVPMLDDPPPAPAPDPVPAPLTDRELDVLKRYGRCTPRTNGAGDFYVNGQLVRGRGE